jgi:hypothetical protein
MKITKSYLKQIIKEELQQVSEIDSSKYSDPFRKMLDDIDAKATKNMTSEQKAEFERKKRESEERFQRLEARQQNILKNQLLKAQAEKDENARMKMYAIIMQLGALVVPSMFYLWDYIRPALGLNEDQENS